MKPKTSINFDPKHWSTLPMKKNILSIVAVGLVLSTVGGVMATQPAEAQCNNNNMSRNQARQIRRMQQRMLQQARLNNQCNPNFAQVNPGLFNVGYNPYAYGSQFGYGNQLGYGNQFYGNQYANPYYNNGLLGNGMIGGGLQRVLGTLF